MGSDDISLMADVAAFLTGMLRVKAENSGVTER
jgi:hypothetical protein